MRTVSLLLVLTIAGCRSPESAPPKSAPGQPVAMPDFSLTDQHGQKLRRDDLIGHVWVADFIYVQCSVICLLQSRRMTELQAKMRGRDVQFVSFSVSPDDGPSSLQKFAKQVTTADQDRWRLLVADKAAFPNLATTLGIARSPEEAARLEIHLWPSFYLVDRKAVVRGIYPAFGDEAQARILKDLVTLSEAP